MSILSAITKRLNQIEKELDELGLLKGGTQPISAPVPAHQRKDVPVMKIEAPVTAADLRPSQYIVYKFGTRVVDNLCVRLGHERVNILAASQIPNSPYEKNMFNGSFYYDQRNQTIFVLQSCFSDPGSYVHLLVHCMAHLNVGDLSDDHNPQFMREYYRSLRVCFDSALFARAKKPTKVQHGVTRLQDFSQLFKQLPSAKERTELVQDVMKLDHQEKDIAKTRFDREGLRSRMAKYQAMNLQNTLLGSYDVQFAADSKSMDLQLHSMSSQLKTANPSEILLLLKQAPSVQPPSAREMLEANIKELEETIDQISAKFPDLSKTKSQAQFSLISRNKELNALTKKIADMNAQSPEYKTLQEKIAQLSAQVSELQDKKDAITVETARLSGRVEKLTEQLEKKRKELHKL
eukprot:TRINITY_DN5709_c0_g1_i11.p1 TRINITY_DN5709_c0_g1~~TRINITY_DN5709_c0_g1_i11.p1  ORF type:complete len:406 (-),score=103.56 TRINITY_DN5709_c0_g1_i11:189-1406(-)